MPQPLFHHWLACTKGLKPHHVQALAKLIEYFVPAQRPGRSETTPENPASSLEYALTIHIVRSFVRTVILVSVEIQDEQSVIRLCHANGVVNGICSTLCDAVPGCRTSSSSASAKAVEKDVVVRIQGHRIGILGLQSYGLCSDHIYGQRVGLQ
jgi:hypothetical protein